MDAKAVLMRLRLEIRDMKREDLDAVPYIEGYTSEEIIEHVYSNVIKLIDYVFENESLNDTTGHDYQMGYNDGGNYVLEQLLEKIIEAMYNSTDEAKKYWPTHRQDVQTAIENAYSQVKDWVDDIKEELKDETK